MQLQPKIKTYAILFIVGFALILTGAACNKIQNANRPSSYETPGSGDGTDTIGNNMNSNSSENENYNINSYQNTNTGVVGQTRTFSVEGGMYYFNQKEIRVKQGDTVRIVFTNKEGLHDWVIDEFNAKTPRISAGNTAVVEFVANKTGTFEYYCSVGNHRAMGMKGTLIIE